MYCRCCCCKVHFLSDTSAVRTACSDTIREIVSPATGLAVELLSRMAEHTELSYQRVYYQYEVDGDDKPCQIVIEVKGMYNLFIVNIIHCICLKILHGINLFTL